MKRIGIGLLVGIAVIGLLAWIFRDALTLRLVGRMVARNMQSTLLDELPDGLHVGLCGAGSPLPDPNRSGPCVFVVAGEQLYIVDSGSGAARILSRTRVPMGRIDGILLTHFHSDHIDGLGELELQRWVNGAHREPVPVYGPLGVEQVVDGFNLAYTPDHGYRVAHHGDSIVPRSGAGGVARPFATPPDGESVLVVERDGLTIRAFRVDHTPVEPAVGYRFDYGGRSVVISGDTRKSANLESFAKDVDLLVHEALSTTLVAALTDGATAVGRQNLAQITRDIVDYHTSPVEAAETARDAGVGHLLFYHIVPPLLVAPMEGIFLDGVDAVYEGPVTLGRDGTLIRLEAGGDSIDVQNLL